MTKHLEMTIWQSQVDYKGKSDIYLLYISFSFFLFFRLSVHLFLFFFSVIENSKRKSDFYAKFRITDSKHEVSFLVLHSQLCVPLSTGFWDTFQLHPFSPTSSPFSYFPCIHHSSETLSLCIHVSTFRDSSYCRIQSTVGSPSPGGWCSMATPATWSRVRFSLLPCALPQPEGVFASRCRFYPRGGSEKAAGAAGASYWFDRNDGRRNGAGIDKRKWWSKAAGGALHGGARAQEEGRPLM